MDALSAHVRRPTPLPGPTASWLPLLRHPATPCPGALALDVRVARTRAEQLQLTYRLRGDPGSVLLPKRNKRPAPQPELWRHTCFEAFVGSGNSSAYHEFNFSPRGDWAVFAFSDWRQRVADCSQALRPGISLRTAATEVSLHVVLPLPAPARGEAAGPSGPLLGLSAVIAHHDGQRCYWALAHPCDDPDFHARAGWLLPLPPVRRVGLQR